MTKVETSLKHGFISVCITSNLCNGALQKLCFVLLAQQMWKLPQDLLMTLPVQRCYQSKRWLLCYRIYLVGGIFAYFVFFVVILKFWILVAKTKKNHAVLWQVLLHYLVSFVPQAASLKWYNCHISGCAGHISSDMITHQRCFKTVTDIGITHPESLGWQMTFYCRPTSNTQASSASSLVRLHGVPFRDDFESAVDLPSHNIL